MPSHPDHARARLGDMLVRRRIELNPRYRNRRTFTDERAPGLYRIINDIELGRRDNYEPGTIAALEAAYAITPGSIGRSLDGGEIEAVGPPVLALAPAPPPDDGDALEGFPFKVTPAMRARIPRVLEAVKADVATAVEKYPGQVLSGEMVFPNAPVPAGYWDDLAALGWMPDRIVAGVTVWMARRAEKAEQERRDGSATGLIRRYLAGHVRNAQVTIRLPGTENCCREGVVRVTHLTRANGTGEPQGA